MRELDVVMRGYLEHYYTAASTRERAQFEALLEMTDPELYRLLLGRDQATEAGLQPLLGKIRGLSVNA